jgi:hypothetical protein
MTVADASSESTLPGPANADWPSRFEMPVKPQVPDEVLLPQGDKDLRETFDLPLVSARDAERAGAATETEMADAASLLQDRGRSRRRVAAAEARAQARRCSHCGGLVPQGMSICVSCGTDQETGMRVGLEDDLAPPPPPPPQGPPIHIAVMGGLCGTAGLILLIVSLIRSVGTSGDWLQYGWLCVALVSAFGIFASVQFIRGRSAKLLMTALTLGVVIDLLTLIAMPLIQPYFQDVEKLTRIVNPDDLDVGPYQIEQAEKQIDIQRIELGVTLIMVYTVLSWYLMSPPVKRYIHPRAMDRSPW